MCTSFVSRRHTIFPSNFRPSPSHRFLKLLQDRDKLLRNYTQNIDTLEQAAGITRVLQCHGSFATATCTDKAACGYSVDGSQIKESIFRKEVPRCPRCVERRRAASELKAQGKRGKKKKAKGDSSGRAIWKEEDEDSEDDREDEAMPGMGVLKVSVRRLSECLNDMIAPDGRAHTSLPPPHTSPRRKPDITFFGEKLSSSFERHLLADRPQADLVVVMGTSLKVAPVAELLTHMPHRLPVLLINRTPILHFQTDLMLLGESDTVVQWLCDRLGWTLPPPQPVREVVGEGSKAAEQADKSEAQDGEAAAASGSTLIPGKGQAAPAKASAAQPTRWEGSEYIWTWPGADTEMLERLRAKQAQEEEDEDEDGEDEEEEDDGEAGEEGPSPLEPEV